MPVRLPTSLINVSTALTCCAFPLIEMTVLNIIMTKLFRSLLP